MIKRRNTPDTRVSVIIANNEALSETLRIGHFSPRGLGVLVPAAWTAADLALEVSQEGTTWVRLYDSIGVFIRITGIATAESRLYSAPAEAWMVGAWPFLRLASIHPDTGAPINQGAARTLFVALIL